MPENKMKEVAHMLGLEIGEEFKVKGNNEHNKYKFTDTDLVYDSESKMPAIVTLYDLLKGEDEIIKIPKSILTEEEKEDLSGIIRLFRDEVISICKFESMRHCGYEFLSIKINNNVFKYETTLPYFKKWAMYKGMKLEKEYSLEELGL